MPNSAQKVAKKCVASECFFGIHVDAISILKSSENGAKRQPRTPQDSPRSPHRAPLGHPRAPSRCLSAPLVSPRAPKGVPKGPRGSPDTPNGAKWRPNDPPDIQNGAKMIPKWHPKDSLVKQARRNARQRLNNRKWA